MKLKVPYSGAGGISLMVIRNIHVHDVTRPMGIATKSGRLSEVVGLIAGEEALMRRHTEKGEENFRTERRHYERLEVQSGAFASLSPQFAIIGQVVNISQGGLAFRYVASVPRSPETHRLNIVLTDGSFCIEKLNFRSVWDVPTPQEFACGLITYRHCGVEWGRLDSAQRADLAYFMKCYTTDSSHGAFFASIH